MRGNYTERDAHLSEAKLKNPTEQPALDVLRAEFLLDQKMPEQALASLSEHEDEMHSNPKITSLFANAYEQMSNWNKLADIIPLLKIKPYKVYWTAATTHLMLMKLEQNIETVY
jgi:HemY protein